MQTFVPYGSRFDTSTTRVVVVYNYDHAENLFIS